MRHFADGFRWLLPLSLLWAAATRPVAAIPQVEKSVWLRISNDTAQKASGARAFTIGNRAYVGTGQRTQTTYLTDFREYDPQTMTWTAKAAFPGGPTAFACAFSIGDKGYLGLGNNNTTVRNSFWEYDPVTNAWSSRAAFPGEERVRALGLSAGGKGYVMMGIGAGDVLFKDLWAYDPATNAWTQKTSCPGNARSGPVGFAVGDKLYVGLGEAQTAIDPSWWEYDTRTDAWTQKTAFPGELRWGATATALGARGYVGTGGGTEGAHLSDVWEYNPATDQWARIASLPTPGRTGAVAFALDQDLYWGLGADAAGASLGDVWRTCPHGFFGQSPPGLVPKVIATDFLGSPGATIFAGTMSPDGTEYCYTLAVGNSRTIMGTQLVNGAWTTPAPAAFAAGYSAMEPHITLDNQTVYWSWLNAPQMGIYAADRTAQGWSAARYVGFGMYVNSSRDGLLYVTDLSEGFDAYLAQVTLHNGTFDQFNHLTGGVAALHDEYPNQAHPGVAPDGSYILFDVNGGSYLFVCFRNARGNWGPAVDLTRHGIDPLLGIPSVSPDGQYAFFGRIPGDYYWVSAELITNLGPGSHPVGDVNADGQLNSLDLLLLQLVLSGATSPDRAPAGNATGADWDCNGRIESEDAAGLARQLSGA